jgi:hypothetical protein
VQRKNGAVTYWPIWDWQASHVFEYLAGRDIPAKVSNGHHVAAEGLAGPV